MGMFDDITVNQPLPGEPKPPTCCFQTKDFDCELAHYEITRDGRLLKEGADTGFHGWFEFHEYDTRTHMWWSYKAKFTDGLLIEICPVSIYENGIGGAAKVFYPPESEFGESTK